MFYDARIYCPACGCSHSFQYSYESPGTGKGCLIPGNPYLEVYGIAERCEREFCGHVFTETELKAAARADMRARFSMAMAS